MRQKISTKLMNSMAELLRLSPNYFSFLGGIVIGASINIYTGIFVTDTRPTKWIFLLIASILLFVSGLYWTRIAWRLEKLHNAPEWVQKKEEWRTLQSSELRKFVIYFAAACITAVAGLLILIV